MFYYYYFFPIYCYVPEGTPESHIATSDLISQTVCSLSDPPIQCALKRFTHLDTEETVSSSHCYICCKFLKLPVSWHEDCRIRTPVYSFAWASLGCTILRNNIWQCGENIIASSKLKLWEVIYYFSICISLFTVY